MNSGAETDARSDIDAAFAEECADGFRENGAGIGDDDSVLFDGNANFAAVGAAKGGAQVFFEVGFDSLGVVDGFCGVGKVEVERDAAFFGEREVFIIDFANN